MILIIKNALKNPSIHTMERAIAFILASHGSLRFYGHFKAEIKIPFYIGKKQMRLKLPSHSTQL